MDNGIAWQNGVFGAQTAAPAGDGLDSDGAVLGGGARAVFTACWRTLMGALCGGVRVCSVASTDKLANADAMPELSPDGGGVGMVKLAVNFVLSTT